VSVIQTKKNTTGIVSVSPYLIVLLKLAWIYKRPIAAERHERGLLKTPKC
jgi:hypothetical protein